MVHPHECDGLPSISDVLREAARAVCEMCTTELPTVKKYGRYSHHGYLCPSHSIHALLEKEGSNNE
jgi:hypothetical protein